MKIARETLRPLLFAAWRKMADPSVTDAECREAADLLAHAPVEPALFERLHTRLAAATERNRMALGYRTLHRYENDQLVQALAIEAVVLTLLASALGSEAQQRLESTMEVSGGALLRRVLGPPRLN